MLCFGVAVPYPLPQEVCCGVFGAIAPMLKRTAGQPNSNAWGVVHGGLPAKVVASLGDAPGVRDGAMLLATDEWYAREVGAQGRLGAIRDLHAVAGIQGEGGSLLSCRAQVKALLNAVRRQYLALARGDWVEDSRW